MTPVKDSTTPHRYAARNLRTGPSVYARSDVGCRSWVLRTCTRCMYMTRMQANSVYSASGQ